MSVILLYKDPPNLLLIALNILEPTNDISSNPTSCNCSCQHVNLFNELNDKFGKLNNDCWTCIFNIECIIIPSILNTNLLVNTMNIVLIFVKFKYMCLFYNHNNVWIISWKVKFLLVPTPTIKNKWIDELRYNFSMHNVIRH